MVVLDLQLSGLGGPVWDDLGRLTAAGRRVVDFTVRDDEQSALRCLEAGCATYLTKAEGERHLVDAVRAVAQDRSFVPPSLAGAMAADRSADRPQLTDREREVLLAWFQCESKQLVAERCGLSPKTVEGYIGRVRLRYARVGRSAPTKAGLLARALQDGLVDLAEL